MDINLWGVLLATVAMFAVGAFWYSVPFAKAWGRIHGFDKLSKEEQRAAMSKMGPLYALQALVTLISAWVLAYFIVTVADTSPYLIAFLVWLGFIVPANVSAVLFGSTPSKFMVSKTAIMLGGSLLCILAGAFVLSFF